jgi:phage shock protein PspC (stress-responsive transcriptional regulator)
MKKVININFSGRLINIEEDAYTQLQTYIESLKKYFSNEEGKEEIIADIENRIAEIFYDKQNKGLAAITTIEVDEIIATIGKPEDFGEPEEANTQNSSNTSSEQKQYVHRGKLYRNANDKMLGGVCSGIAAYFNIDIVLVRVIFAILLFGAGVGFLLYIILWIVLPESNSVETSLERKLYRDTEDRVIGGVSSGISKYFGIDVWIPRLIFVAPFALAMLRGVSFFAYPNLFEDRRFWTFSFGGTTTIVYFLLWWIIPEAKTVQEKMAMKGEKMDLDSIKNNVQDSIKNFTEKANAWGRDVTNKSTEWTRTFNQRTQENVARANTVVRGTGNKIGHGIGLLIKAFALFIGGIIALSLLAALIAVLGSGVAFWPLKSFILEGFWQNTFAWGSFLVLVVPGVAFLVWLCRRIFKLKNNIRPIRLTLSGLFFLGIVSAIFLATSLVSQFQYDNDRIASNEIVITQPKERLLVKVSEPQVIYSGSLPWLHIEEDGFDINEDTVKYSNIKMRVDKSNDSLYHTIIKKYSRGSNRKEAEEKAQKIQFNYSQIGDVLDLGSNIAISKNEKFRGQQVLVIIQVPVGKKIQFDETIDAKLHPFNVRVTERREDGRRVYYKREKVFFTNDYFFDYKLNEDYIMGKDAELRLANPSKEDKQEEKQKSRDEKRQREIEKRDSIMQKLDKEKDSIENLDVINKLSPTTEDHIILGNPLSFACIPFSI